MRILSAHPAQPQSGRSRAYGDVVDDNVVRVNIDRGLKSGKIDTALLSPDEAIELATQILTAVSILRKRANDA